MDHRDHVGLLREGVPARAADASAPPVWADIGAGEGAFTLALAHLLGPGARIIAVDRDRWALGKNQEAVAQRFPETDLEVVVGDLAGSLDLPPLDGLVAANSLHFVARDRQLEVVRRLAGRVRPGGTFLLVEYDADHGNPWVPHPFSFGSWERMAAECGLAETRRIGRVPSRFLGAIYSAASRVPGAADDVDAAG
jgi:SAM-dependent methyltransferase